MLITNMPRTRKRSEHYVNNKEFLAAIIEYKQQIVDAEQLGNPKPRIPNYIGECFLKIATHLNNLMEVKKIYNLKS